MKIQEIKEIAKKLGLKTLNLNKGDLIRAIQTKEGNIPCFCTRHMLVCGQPACLWRDDCD